MTLAELKERIKEEVVLHEGDLKEWQWRRNGLLTEAEQDGIASAEFMRLVNDVSYQLGGLFPRINTLKTTAEAYARADKKQLLPFHLEEIVTEAERLTLSRSFVTQRWLPAILATIPDPPKSETPPSIPVAAPVPIPVVETRLSRDEVRQKIASRLDAYKSQSIIPSWLLSDLLNSIKADDAVVTEEIFSYLVNNLFKAVREPQGNSLRERLISSDWQNVLYKSTQEQTPLIPQEPYYSEPSRVPETPPFVRSFTAQPARIHKGETVTLSWEVDNLLAVTIDDLGAGLSPVNRGWVKPNKTTDYTLFDANNNPLSTVRVEVIPRDRSGIYGVLFALALLAIIYWFIKSSNARDREPESKPKTEQTTHAKEESSSKKKEPVAHKKTGSDVATSEATDTPISNPSEPEVAMAETAPKEQTPARKPVATTPLAEQASSPKTPTDARVGKYEESFGDKPYDKVELGTDEQGWRRARRNGRWGFINEDDEWVIQPDYEAVTPFRGNTASVFLNGRLLTINRAGDLVSK